MLVTAGQANDGPMFSHPLAELHVPRRGPGRPRTRPKTVIADKAYSARAHRAELRRRGITVVIREPSDQIRHRKNRGSAGGRPPTFDVTGYRARNVVERAFTQLKGWRRRATRYDKHALTYRGGLVLASALLWLKQ